MAENDAIASLLAVLSAREKQARIVVGSRNSDAAQRITAERYLRALAVFRFVLTEHEDDRDALDDPVVAQVVTALGLDVDHLTARDGDGG